MEVCVCGVEKKDDPDSPRDSRAFLTENKW